MSDEATEIETKALDQIISMFKKDPPVGKIGVLGKQSRNKSETTNAEIGAKHEFGLDGMPVRSWLRVPLMEHLEKYLEKSGAFNENSLRKVINDKSLLTYVQKMLIVAESVVADGFASGGFGRWEPSNMARKKVKLTLVETQQLRNSVSTEIKGE